MTKNTIGILIIFMIAAFFRFWQLGSVPASLNWDEVALGYNAYSVMQTGKDEYGQFYPLIMRSYDDYKPALYMYLTIPFIALLGLSDVAVRFPSAIAGVTTVILTYFFVKELVKVKKEKEGKNSMTNYELAVTSYLPLFSAGLLAISPWHIQFSRVAFEANVSLMFTIAGIVLFLKSLKNSHYLIPSAILFALTYYTYQSAKVFTTLLIGLLLVLYWKETVKIERVRVVSVLVFILVSIPFFWVTLTNPDALLRAKGVSIFTEDNPRYAQSIQRTALSYEKHDVVGIILNNRRVIHTMNVMNGYLSHFNPEWLFLPGTQYRFSPPGAGLLYIFELPFLLYGIYTVSFSSFQKRIKILLFGIILITPIASSITRDVPHPIRVLTFLPILQIFTALGIVMAFQRIRKMNFVLRWGFSLCVLAVCLFNVIQYSDNYFIQYNRVGSSVWQYGYQDAFSKIDAIKENYTKVVFSNIEPLEQSYMFYLFYTGYDPKKYLEEGGTVSGGFAEKHSFGMFEFRPITDEDRKREVLMVGRSADIPQMSRVIDRIYYLDGTPAIVVADGNL